MLPPMISRKIKHVVALTFVLGLGMAATPRDVAASSNSTIYSFGTTDGDGAVPKRSLTYVNGLLFGRTTMTTPSGGYGVIFHFDPNNVASTYSIDHTFAGHPDDGDNPRHDAMTPFNGLARDYFGRWNKRHRDHLFDRAGWHWLPGAFEPCEARRRRVA